MSLHMSAKDLSTQKCNVCYFYNTDMQLTSEDRLLTQILLYCMVAAALYTGAQSKAESHELPY